MVEANPSFRIVIEACHREGSRHMIMTSRIDFDKYDRYYTEVSNAINANPNTECLQ